MTIAVDKILEDENCKNCLNIGMMVKSNIIYEKAMCAVAFLDMDGIITEYNNKFGDIFIIRNDVENLCIFKALNIDKTQLISSGYKHIEIDFTETDILDMPICLRNQSLKNIFLSFEAISFENENVGFFVQVEDVTQKKQIIESDKQREKMAALGQLAGGVAHDFNNQLMSIIGNATMIQKATSLEKTKEYGERIIHISQGAANLTKKVLMFSRKESSVNELVNLKRAMSSIAEMIESILDKRIDIGYEYNATNQWIMGDETQIENLIFNLVINSRDAVDTAGKIRIITEDAFFSNDVNLSHGEIMKKGEYIKVSVIDNGLGMSQETINKMFEPYFSTKTKSKGTGLGLSVVFGTIKSHSGYVNVKSKINCGTTIEVYLPISKTKLNLEKSHNNNNLDNIENNMIMLVDDDTNVLEIEAELFEDLGYEVEKFDRPLNALEYYNNASNKISIAVLDMMMPQMNGRELYEKLKNINKDIKVIFISGYSFQDDRESLLKEGAIFIEKPFTFEELSVKMARLY